MPFGHIHAVNLTQQTSLVSKRVGYLASAVCLHRATSSRRSSSTRCAGLQSSNHMGMRVADRHRARQHRGAAGAARAGGGAARARAGERAQEGRVALHRFYQVEPSCVDALADKLRCAADKDPAVMGAPLHLLHEMIEADPASMETWCRRSSRSSSRSPSTGCPPPSTTTACRRRGSRSSCCRCSRRSAPPTSALPRGCTRCSTTCCAAPTRGSTSATPSSTSACAIPHLPQRAAARHGGVTHLALRLRRQPQPQVPRIKARVDCAGQPEVRARAPDARGRLHGGPRRDARARRRAALPHDQRAEHRLRHRQAAPPPQGAVDLQFRAGSPRRSRSSPSGPRPTTHGSSAR